MSAVSELLAQLDAAREKATPGEWEVLPEEGIWASSPTGDFGTFVTTLEDLSDADAAWIVAATSAVPRLMAAIRAVEALAEELAAKCPPDDWGSGGIEDAIVADTARGFLSALAAALVPAAVAGDTDGEGER